MSECRAASPKIVEARWTPGQLTIAATGETPSSGWRVDIEMPALDAEPPRFSIIECRTSGIDRPVTTPYLSSRTFELAANPGSTIEVDTEDGMQTITVETPSEPLGNTEHAVWGAGTDLSEAMSAALRALRNDEHPNAPITAVVEEIRYTEGGIMPPLLEVSIRRA